MKETDLKKALGRAALGYCPNCGKGRLFSSYLKPIDQCSSCAEKLGHIRADDGPAWLTIIIVGHLLAPFILGVLPNIDWSDMVVTLVLIALIIVLTLFILPRAKGLFIGFIWHSGCKGS